MQGTPGAGTRHGKTTLNHIGHLLLHDLSLRRASPIGTLFDGCRASQENIMLSDSGL